MFTALFIDNFLYFALIGGPYGAQPVGLGSEKKPQVRYGKLCRILYVKQNEFDSHFVQENSFSVLS